MNKYIIVLLVFLSACGSGTEYNDPFRGTSGLDVSFVRNAPPDQIYEEQQFPIGINMVNKGAYDIDNGILSISLSADYFDLEVTDDKNILLYGKSAIYQQGEEVTRMFYYKAKQLDKMSQVHDFKALVSACYEYGTKLNTDICIDPDVYNLKEGEKPCETRDQSFSGQGAPVAITHIKQTTDFVSQDEIKPSFELTIRNVGRGEVIDRGQIRNYCTSQSMYGDEFGKIDISVRINDEELDCEKNTLTLRDSEVKVRCRANEPLRTGASAFTTMMTIDLQYGYSISTSKKIRVEKP